MIDVLGDCFPGFVSHMVIVALGYCRTGVIVVPGLLSRGVNLTRGNCRPGLLSSSTTVVWGDWSGVIVVRVNVVRTGMDR